MSLSLVLFLQAIAGPPAPVAPRPRPAEPARCTPAAPDEITVCGNRGDNFRLKPLPDRYTADRAPPRAEVRVFGDGKLSLDSEQGSDAQGGAINRAMVRLKIPLGRKRR